MPSAATGPACSSGVSRWARGGLAYRRGSELLEDLAPELVGHRDGGPQGLEHERRADEVGVRLDVADERDPAAIGREPPLEEALVDSTHRLGDVAGR